MAHLSKHLLEKANDLLVGDRDDMPPEERREMREMVEELVNWTRRGRFAALSPEDRDHWARLLVSHGHATRVIDEEFTLEALRRVPKKVARVLKLSELWVAEPLDPETAVLLAESIRAYAEGLPGAAIALARATLERALKAALGLPDTVGFAELLKRAELSGRLRPDGVDAADQVRQIGNTFLHRGSGTHQNAEAAIMHLREVLRQLGKGGLGEQSHA